jgi:hypothetical protein
MSDRPEGPESVDYRKVPLSTRLGPGHVVYDKKILRLPDLLNTGLGSRVQIGASDVAIYSDRLIVVTIGNGPKALPRGVRFRLQGDISHLMIKQVGGAPDGRVVIYSGIPSLGSDFDREDPDRMQRYNYAQVGLTWALATGYGDGGAITLPNMFLGEECFYLYSLRARRHTVDDLVTGVEFIESESGTDHVLWSHEVLTGSNRLVWENPGRPVRISSSGKFRFYGPNNAANTSLEYDIEIVYI